MQRLAILLGLALFGFQCAHGQRTYMRTCDCEYTVDGKCAYTLVLPKSTDQSCPAGSGSSDDVQELAAKVTDIDSRLSRTIQTSLSNADVLGQLQSVVISLQHGFLNWSNSTGQTSISSYNRSELLSLQDAILSTQDNQKYIQANLNIVSGVTTRLQGQMDNLTSQVQMVKTNITMMGNDTQQEQAMFADIQQKIEDVSSTLNRLQQSGVLCQNKGLIVSGNIGMLPLSSINVSSMYNSIHGPNQSRIFNNGTPGAWCPGYPNAAREWIQYDLGTPRPVYGIATKGRYDFAQWVTTYSVQYINNLQDPQGWKYYQDILGTTMVFPGNSDQNTLQTNMLWQPLVTRYIRIVALSAVGNMCMRADLIGCVDP